MVELVDSKDLGSFAKTWRVGSSPTTRTIFKCLRLSERMVLKHFFAILHLTLNTWINSDSS